MKKIIRAIAVMSVLASALPARADPPSLEACAGNGKFIREIATARDNGVSESDMLAASNNLEGVSDHDKRAGANMIAGVYLITGMTPAEIEAQFVAECLARIPKVNAKKKNAVRHDETTPSDANVVCAAGLVVKADENGELGCYKKDSE